MLGLALDPDLKEAGVISRGEGEWDADECDQELRAMCDEGMVGLRGAAKMQYLSAVATSRPGDAPPGQYRTVCGVALLITADKVKVMDMYRPGCDQIWPQPLS